MKTLKVLSVLFLATALSWGIVSCGDDDPVPTLPTLASDNTENTPKEEEYTSSDEIDTEVFIIVDNEIFMGVNTMEDGWYIYVLQFGFGVTDRNDAYEQGMTKMRLTVWADNGCMTIPYSTSKYGLKKTYTLYLSYQEELYEWIYVCSRDTRIAFNYNLEYYNSNNGHWYSIQNRNLTFSKETSGNDDGHLAIKTRGETTSENIPSYYTRNITNLK